MNTQLVESLVQIVRSLTPEEQSLFEAKFKAKKHNWQEQRQKIHALKASQALWALCDSIVESADRDNLRHGFGTPQFR